MRIDALKSKYMDCWIRKNDKEINNSADGFEPSALFLFGYFTLIPTYISSYFMIQH